MNVVDPVAFIKELWPDVYLYDKQREVAYSVWHNDETFVPAGNMLGKDFVAGLITLAFFLSRHPCRIVTTSVDATQLNAVLWGEMRRFIQSCKYPLSATEGGPLVINDLHLRKVVNGKVCGLSYVLGRVANQTGEGMLGHHIALTGDGIPRTLFVADEASGVPSVYFEKAETWANSKLVIGNCFECENNFKWAVEGRRGTEDKGGDIPRSGRREGYFRKVIKITARDSPNVKYALREIELGREPTNRIIVPGVKSWNEYEKNLALWDQVKQTVSLKAEFYKGSDNLMFPPNWLDRAEQLAREYSESGRKAVTIGVDTAEGGDKSSWCIIDHSGILDLISMKTPDTSVIPGQTIALMQRWGVPAEMVLFDRGGGGKQHADNLREKGYEVRTVGFGEMVTPQRKRGMTTLDERVEQDEEKYTYKNRRAEMYHLIRLLIDPSEGKNFAIPERFVAIRDQLSPIPLDYDQEGRIKLPPKNKTSKESKELTLIELIGHSPDEADSLALAVYGLSHTAKRVTAGAAW